MFLPKDIERGYKNVKN
jgi:hypothetical protein